MKRIGEGKRFLAEERQRPLFIVSVKAKTSLRRSSALVMSYAEATSSNASPIGRGTTVLTWKSGDRLLVTISAERFYETSRAEKLTGIPGLCAPEYAAPSNNPIRFLVVVEIDEHCAALMPPFTDVTRPGA